MARLIKPNDRAFADKSFRVIGANGEQLGVLKMDAACRAAQDARLDLVVVAENSEPMVCKIMDFGKLCYEQKKKLKDQKKKSAASGKVKEIKFRLHIDTHDFDLKVKHCTEFLAEGCKLKVTLPLRGREMSHSEMAFDLAKRVIAALDESGVVESPPKLFGKSIFMSFNPKATAKVGREASATLEDSNQDSN